MATLKKYITWDLEERKILDAVISDIQSSFSHSGKLSPSRLGAEELEINSVIGEINSTVHFLDLAYKRIESLKQLAKNLEKLKK